MFLRSRQFLYSQQSSPLLYVCVIYSNMVFDVLAIVEGQLSLSSLAEIVRMLLLMCEVGLN